jgi:hypothetical protein
MAYRKKTRRQAGYGHRQRRRQAGYGYKRRRYGRRRRGRRRRRRQRGRGPRWDAVKSFGKRIGSRIWNKLAPAAASAGKSILPSAAHLMIANKKNKGRIMKGMLRKFGHNTIRNMMK